MPRLISFRLAAACALAIVLFASLVAIAVAKGVSAEIRVVGKGGRVLTEQTLRTGTTKIKTSPKATCFGVGTGGSGKPVTIKGPTALGMLIQAAGFTAALKPLLISDHFSFGLALCGVGGNIAHGEGSWYLKVNHKSPSVGGEKVKLHPGDEVLWDLAPSYPYPNELTLDAPESATAGAPFEVRVFSYDEKGKRRPVSGAKVTGASSLTGADGRTEVTLSAPTELTATHGKDIPSPAQVVCIGSGCSAVAGIQF